MFQRNYVQSADYKFNPWPEYAMQITDSGMTFKWTIFGEYGHCAWSHGSLKEYLHLVFQQCYFWTSMKCAMVIASLDNF